MAWPRHPRALDDLPLSPQGHESLRVLPDDTHPAVLEAITNDSDLILQLTGGSVELQQNLTGLVLTAAVRAVKAHDNSMRGNPDL